MRLGSATPRWLFSFENSRYPASKIRSRLPVECRWFTALWNSAARSEPLQKSRSNCSVLLWARWMVKSLRKMKYQDMKDTTRSSSITS